MNAIFLDVDGVLCLRGGSELDPECLQNLADLIRITEAGVIVSSTWRLIPPSMRQLERELIEMGAKFVKKTPDLSREGLGRSAEIVYSLDIFEPQGVENWVILDDNDVAREKLTKEKNALNCPAIVDHFVMTDRRKGFDGEALVKALKILGVKDELEKS